MCLLACYFCGEDDDANFTFANFVFCSSSQSQLALYPDTS